MHIIATSKFGQLDRAMEAKLNRLSLTQARELVLVIQKLQSPAEFTRWLKKHATNGS